MLRLLFHRVREVLAGHVEESPSVHLMVNSIHLLKVNSLFLCIFPSSRLKIDDKTSIASKKALSLRNNVFNAVLLVFRACEEILGGHSPPKQSLANLLGASTETVFPCITVDPTGGRCRVRTT